MPRFGLHTISSKHTKIRCLRYFDNEILVISDGIEGRAGTITSEKERFMRWKTIDGEKPRKGLTEIEVLLRGICDKRRLLDIARNFVVFEKDKEKKKKTSCISSILGSKQSARVNNRGKKRKQEGRNCVAYSRQQYVTGRATEHSPP